MKGKFVVLIAVACLMAAVSVASAELVQGIAIDFVSIGNPGNPADTQVMVADGTTGYGAVGYEYRIGKYEVTNGQWHDFVAAAGAPTGNPWNAYNEDAHWRGTNMPTNMVSWYEATQFCNYLTSGDKSQGAYQWSGDNTNPGSFEGIDRDSAVSTYGITYVIPTEDEWYKAAYYTGSGYSSYANGTRYRPIMGDDTNYGQNPLYAGPWDVGNGTEEQNGTFDMMGNVWEWNETFIPDNTRGLRGGAYYPNVYSGNNLRSSCRVKIYPEYEYYLFGFRVASVPEPATLLLLGFGGMALLRRRRRV